MQLQLITTPQELQIAIDTAVKSAFQKVTPITQDSQNEQPITVKELCQFLGITEPTIIRWRKKGKIPFMQIGSRILFQKSKVIAALESKKKGA
ncbi:helix-turn-helix domain-containing protein [Mucilaginibacter sp. L196]|uniref:helix-turn-helix domain-containing protein n=1 Tax=Mucilaginibacter sp. L196 TaxID=1641870 RepID=UPI00131C0CA9|nr:helix-turn-helix domain-containing protein [Mucilaginibacter sp. L196]